MTVTLLLGGTIAFLVLEWNNPATLGGMTVIEKIFNALFQSTTLRTAGFATIDQAGLTTGGQILSIIFMFIGGSPNSTAGGLKTTTLLIILIFLFTRPNEKGDVILGKRRISGRVIRKSIKIFMSQLIALVVAVIAISIIDSGISVNAILFECVSAIGTVGLTMGITTTLSVVSQLILCLLMFIGRVGLLTIGLAVSASPANSDIEYQNTDIIVG